MALAKASRLALAPGVVADPVRVFSADPNLLEGIDDPRAVHHLKTRMAVALRCADPGAWRPQAPDDLREHVGLLVLRGYLSRSISLAGRDSAEIVGPGDLLRPWDADEPGATVACDARWRVLLPAAMADLDDRFAQSAARWPAITAALLARSTVRSRWLLAQSAIPQIRHADQRVLVLLWHLADRWGTVTPAGVYVPVPLTHRLIGAMTGLQRPTVSTTVRLLTHRGAVTPARRGRWILHDRPAIHELEAMAELRFAEP